MTRDVIETLLGMIGGISSLVAGIGDHPKLFAVSTLCVTTIWGLYLFDKHCAGGDSV